MIELKITADTVEDLHSQMARLLSSSAPAATPPAEEPKPQRQQRQAQSPPPPPPPVEEPTPQAETPAETPPADEPAGLTYDGDIKPAVLRVSEKHGRPGVEKLLAEFGVANAKEVPEARWPEFMAAIAKLVG